MKKLETNESYHANPAVGSTLLKSIHKSSLLHAITNEFTGSDSVDFGNAVHTRFFEPESFDSRFIVKPNVDGRTKEGKEINARFAQEAEGRTVITQDQFDGSAIAIKNLMAHSIAGAIFKGGEAEYSYYTHDNETGLTLKCRPDYFVMNALVDLKTTRDASVVGFKNQARQLAYHIQAAYYLDVFNLANNTNIKEFYFVAIENTAPYAVNVFKLPEAEIELGRAQYKRAKRLYAEYLKDTTKLNNFGYEEVIHSLDFPNYAFEDIGA